MGWEEAAGGGGPWVLTSCLSPQTCASGVLGGPGAPVRCPAVEVSGYAGGRQEAPLEEAAGARGLRLRAAMWSPAQVTSMLASGGGVEGSYQEVAPGGDVTSAPGGMCWRAACCPGGPKVGPQHRPLPSGPQERAAKPRTPCPPLTVPTSALEAVWTSGTACSVCRDRAGQVARPRPQPSLGTLGAQTRASLPPTSRQHVTCGRGHATGSGVTGQQSGSLGHFQQPGRGPA